MAKPDETDAESPGPHTDRNPGTLSPTTSQPATSQERPSVFGDTPRSSTLTVQSAALSPQSDTLLSAPLPAERALEERLASCERRLDEVTDRLEILERRPAAAVAPSDRSYWFWLIFLSGLALAWQILRWLR